MLAIYIFRKYSTSCMRVIMIHWCLRTTSTTVIRILISAVHWRFFVLELSPIKHRGYFIESWFLPFLICWCLWRLTHRWAHNWLWTTPTIVYLKLALLLKVFSVFFSSTTTRCLWSPFKAQGCNQYRSITCLRSRRWLI